jgi:broad specificity phosphatase PhoE
MLKTTSNMVANLQNKTLYICRHGKTVWNTEGKIQGTLNSPLTSEGISQAKNVSDALIDVDFDVFLHSPSMRVLETLSYMSINGRIECDEHLNEIDHGVYEGKYVCDIDSDWYATRKHDVWSTRWIDGESYKDVLTMLMVIL